MDARDDENDDEEEQQPGGGKERCATSSKRPKEPVWVADGRAPTGNKVYTRFIDETSMGGRVGSDPVVHSLRVT